jgi:hypothetical protein
MSISMARREPVPVDCEEMSESPRQRTGVFTAATADQLKNGVQNIRSDVGYERADPEVTAASPVTAPALVALGAISLGANWPP